MTATVQPTLTERQAEIAREFFAAKRVTDWAISFEDAKRGLGDYTPARLAHWIAEYHPRGLGGFKAKHPAEASQ